MSKRLQETTDKYSEAHVSTWRGKPSPFHHTSLDITFEAGSKGIWYCNCSKDGDCKDDQQGSTEKGTCKDSLRVLYFKRHQNCKFRSTLTVNTGNALCG